jgi:hypothetical protein
MLMILWDRRLCINGWEGRHESIGSSSVLPSRNRELVVAFRLVVRLTG